MVRNILRKLLHNKAAMSGLAVILLLVFAGIFAERISPHDPYKVDLAVKLLGPSARYPLGTDQLGRCILSRLIYGTRTSLYTAMTVTLVILAIGVPLGIIAGYIGGAVDNMIMRLADIASTFPSSLLALAIVGIFGPSLYNLMLVFIFLWWAPFARMVRSSVIKLKETEFVMAAEAAGSRRISIILKHIFPNTLSPIIAYATLRIAAVIVHIAGFSFIGLGSQPPTADWGVMLNDGRQYISSYPMLLIWPGLMIVVVVLAFNLFGEGLNDALIPSSEERAIVKETGGANV
ncbi:peptide/nickel transport system permease protein [Sporobacter termitidis DSM 10068]|uniref:Peptide/nickel transport system permease protein n=1 Tax=Sporobacter termitidis DSM 10068 TaxID=1123282 RepID=A0A1M5WIY0_9FIRM|nr:ABC transporter permease subunit [Sporobacter termitidis]SHH87510.1 peptide/nickel transport system permease protein [Sporobacter termitidis DSM 10068]